ncbi:lactonase family protein [Amycolatopsis pithecellobii]|uniref:lactonase family protein n=1 Tax=Amycolatopsis pithecellobii TaxID=664692 RepID=UPI00140D4D69|nr:lactonase family protein [Amycolatopsis pithecellobii]
MTLFDAYIGTFTAEFKASDGQPMGAASRGIERFEFDDDSGVLRFVDETAGLLSPSYLALIPDQSLIYAVERQLVASPSFRGNFRPKTWRFDPTTMHPGAITTFSISSDGSLSPACRISSAGESPSHVSVHPSGRRVYVANYWSGQIASFRVDSAGRAHAPDVVVRDPAPSHSDHWRQAETHVHQVYPLAPGHGVLVTDLGLDRLAAYETQPDGRMAEHPASAVTLPLGTGPMHVVAHPSGRVVYVIGELDSRVHIVASENGFPTCHRASISTAPEGYAGTNMPSEVLISQDSRHLYVINRGSNSVAGFLLDSAGGIVRALGHWPTHGQTPRAATWSPSGRHLLVANQTPGSLVVFARSEDGALHLVGDPVEAHTPSCILIRDRPSR